MHSFLPRDASVAGAVQLVTAAVHENGQQYIRPSLLLSRSSPTAGMYRTKARVSASGAYALTILDPDSIAVRERVRSTDGMARIGGYE